MADNRQKSIRLQQARNSSRRNITQPSRNIQSSFLSRSRYSVSQSNQQQELDNIITKLNSTSDINEQTRILNNASPALRQQVEQIRADILNSQKNTIAQLQKDYDANYRKYKDSKYKSKRADNDRREEKYIQQADKYQARAEAISNILNEMKSGKAYDYMSVAGYVTKVGINAERNKRYNQEAGKQSIQQNKIAQYKTIQEINKAGFASVVDKSGKLIGYETLEKNPTQYRFDKKGEAKFYSSPEFKPIISGGKVTGYTDTINQQSIKPDVMENRRELQNKRFLEDVKDYKKFQNELKEVKLPSGYSFSRDKNGYITGISDKKNNKIYGLEVLPGLTKAYMIYPELRKTFSGNMLDLKEISKQLKKIPQGVVSKTPVVEGWFFDRILKSTKGYESARNSRAILQTKVNRGQKLTLKEQGLYATAIVDEFVSKLNMNLVNLIPNTWFLLVGLVERPVGTAIAVYKSTKRNIGDITPTIKSNPNTIFINLGVMLVELKIISATKKSLSNVIKSNLIKLSPKFKGMLKTGETITLGNKKTGKIKLQVVNKIPKKTLTRQVALSGKTIPVATSTQANKLIGILKRSKSLRKPIPNEANFSPATKILLRKFDSGKITPKELLKLDKLIQTQGAKGILERSFFADPSGKIRPSRLGISDKSASFSDYFSGDVTFKSAKPQILVFKNAKVSSFPKSLQKIVIKIKKGISLTDQEKSKYFQYQFKRTGSFKSVGFFTRESEILLAPGELIKRNKVLGKTFYSGKTISFVETSVFKPTGRLRSLLLKFQKQTLSRTQILELDKLLKKTTGFDYGLSSSPSLSSAIYISPRSIALNSLLFFSYRRRLNLSKSYSRAYKSSRISKTSKISKVRKTSSIGRTSKTSRTSKPSRVSRTSKTSRTSKPSSISRTSKTSKTSKPSRVSRTSKTSKISKVASARYSKTSKKSIQRKPIKKPGYNSYVYKKKVNSKRTLPITKKRALDLLAYHLDKNPSTRGLTIKGILRVSPSVLNRKLKSVPNNYFIKNRKKFILRRLTRGKETYEMIERKPYRRDSKLERKTIKTYKTSKTRATKKKKTRGKR